MAAAAVAEPALDALIGALRRLPGIGEKSARRMALHLLQHDRAGAQRLAASLQAAVANVRHCVRCHTFTESETCGICTDTERDARLLCVVETPADQSAMERTGSYDGFYFVLMGRLSPLDGIGVHDIGLQALLSRASKVSRKRWIGKAVPPPKKPVSVRRIARSSRTKPSVLVN